MKRGLLMASLAFSFLATLAMAQKGNESAARAVAEAERSFCRDVVAMGVRDGFLANLADDSVLFRPHPVPGKKWLEGSPASRSPLTWEPAFAEASAGGDLAYTTGPYQSRRDGPEDKQVFYGNYMSVWKKQADGRWKVVLDTGISYPPPADKTVTLETRDNPPARASKARPDVEAEKAALMNLDREFLKTARARGAVEAYLAYAAGDVKLLRDSKYPARGKDAARALLEEKPGDLSWTPIAADVSRAADLGYTYGLAELKPEGAGGKTEYFNYVRLWRKEGGAWKLALDIASPRPAPPEKK